MEVLRSFSRRLIRATEKKCAEHFRFVRRRRLFPILTIMLAQSFEPRTKRPTSPIKKGRNRVDQAHLQDSLEENVEKDASGMKRALEASFTRINGRALNLRKLSEPLSTHGPAIPIKRSIDGFQNAIEGFSQP